MKKRCGHGLTGKQTEKIFKICLTKEVLKTQSLSNALDFYELIDRVKQNYMTAYQIKKKGHA